MKQIKYIVAVFMIGLIIAGCGSSKISYEVTKNIYLNESKEEITKVFANNNLDVTNVTNGTNAFVVDYKSYSGSESPNSEEDFFEYFEEWKPNWACYNFDNKDRLQSVEYAYCLLYTSVTEVRANEETHPEFKDALEEARAAGVKVLFLMCKVEKDSLRVVEQRE